MWVRWVLVLVCEKTDFYQPCVGKHCEDCQMFVQKSWTKAAQMKEAQGKSLVLVTPVMMMMTMMKKVTCPSFFDSCDFFIFIMCPFCANEWCLDGPSMANSNLQKLERCLDDSSLLFSLSTWLILKSMRNRKWKYHFMTKVLCTEKMHMFGFFPEIMLRMLLQSSGALSLNRQFKIK